LRAALCALLLCAGGAAWPQAGAPAPVAAPVAEYRLKAAYIFNFAVFAEWPADTLAAGEPLQLCAYAGNTLLDALQGLADKAVNGHKLAVRALASDSTRGCHLLVLDRQDRERWPLLHRSLAFASVLTVADDRQIAAAGAMLSLFMEDQRIVFDADLGAVRTARLQISSKLLRLARSVQ
jgi:hypothetical protein